MDNVFQQTCRDGRLYALNSKEHSWPSLIGEIPSRAYHAAVFRSLYILGGIQLADDNAVQHYSIQEITIVKINTRRFGKCCTVSLPNTTILVFTSCHNL